MRILVVLILFAAVGCGCSTSMTPEPNSTTTSTLTDGSVLPTVAEVLKFLEEDGTDKVEFKTAPCAAATMNLIRNGAERGLKFVQALIYFDNPDESGMQIWKGHWIAAIETQEGLIFIEPQTDRIVPGLKEGIFFDNGLIDYAPYHKIKSEKPLIVIQVELY